MTLDRVDPFPIGRCEKLLFSSMERSVIFRDGSSTGKVKGKEQGI